jgi:hypothetical protein
LRVEFAITANKLLNRACIYITETGEPFAVIDVMFGQGVAIIAATTL